MGKNKDQALKITQSINQSIRRGVRNNSTIPVVEGEKIPLLSEQPIQSLGRQHPAELTKKWGEPLTTFGRPGKDRPNSPGSTSSGATSLGSTGG